MRAKACSYMQAMFTATHPPLAPIPCPFLPSPLLQVLQRLGSLESEGVQLSDAHMRAMFTAIDADESGTVDWYELVSFICDVLEHLERDRYIQQLSEAREAGEAGEGAEGGEA